MNFDIRNENGPDILIVPDLPENLRRLSKIRANCLSLLGDWGRANFLYYKGRGFTFSFNNYNASSETVLLARADFPILELQISLGHPIEGQWDGILQPTLATRQFSLSYTPYVNTRAIFKPGKSYRSFDIHFEKFFLQEMASDFPALAEFMNLVEKEVPTVLCPHHHYCTPEMITAIHFIENNPYSFRAQDRLMEYKVKEILIAAIEKVTDIPSSKEIKLTFRDIEALHALKLSIDLDLENIPTLSELSRQAGINEDKLKRGFKKLFGTTIYDYHIGLKMNEAKRLLLETDEPIFKIAYAIGYHHSSNFCLEFKKRFHCEPNYFRKWGKKDW